LKEEGEHKVEDIVQMVTTMETAETRFPFENRLDSGLIEGMTDGKLHDLLSFLKRPAIISQGNWASTSPALSILATVAIPESLISATLNFSQKIAGFYAFRFKTIVKLQVNTNRFQQGRLFMSFTPQDTWMKAKYLQMQQSLIYATQLPRIDFDAATDTEVTMEIPYIAPEMAYDTTTGTGHVGCVNLMVYDPIASTSSELNAEYTIWAHFEDVELMYPTISNNTFVPQAGGGRKLRVKGGSIEQKEADNDSGPVSTALMRVSTAAGILGEIPMLSSVATPASWVASILSRSASALGFSAPLNTDKTCTLQQRTMAKAINVNGADNSINFALSEDNALEVLPSFTSNGIDEMHFMHPLSISTWFRTITWADSVTPLNTLLVFGLSPLNFRIARTMPGTLGAGFDTMPVSYIANMFTFYKGSFKFKFKFVKTEFHSGRLMFAFAPGYHTLAQPTLTTANATYLHRDIVDIRNITEYEFVCPWVANKPMLPNNISYGTLYVAVVNELRHPDTVAPSINILWEVSCVDDWQFAVPSNSGAVPVASTTAGAPQGGDEVVGQPPIQTTQDTQQDDIPTVGGTQLHTSMNMAAPRYTVGEVMTSFRQLIKRCMPAYIIPGSASTNYDQLRPFANDIYGYSAATTSLFNVPAQNVIQDWFIHIINCYAFMRGSVRLKYYCNSSNTNSSVNAITWVNTSNPGYINNVTATFPQNTYAPVVPAPPGIYPNPEISMPWYNQYYMRPIVVDAGTDTGSLYGPNSGVYSRHPTNDSTIVMRGAGDDFSCGFWYCTMPIAGQPAGTAPYW
jgi:hypothetical protein